MTWKWEELTAHDFPRAVQTAAGVCVMPIAVLEKHGDHLPLGTDGLVAQALAERAVEHEPAILFPTFYYGQIHEAKQFPGTMAIRGQLIFELLDNLCEEISRNGLKKIVLLNGHGGNNNLLNFFAGSQLERQRDYTVYVIRLEDYMRPVLETPEWKALMQSAFDFHGGEGETSAVMATYPELVKMQDLTAPGVPQQHLAHLPSVLTATWWYADFPEHYAGDATHATAAKGEFLVEGYAQAIARILKAIKADDITPQLEAEFFARSRH
jgi:creatinine amidohydrolase